jgi:hypothetical protein
MLLTQAAAIDNRRVTDVTAKEWADALDGLDYQDCVAAIRKFRRNSTEYLMPGHIRELVRIVLADRLDRQAFGRGLEGPPPATLETKLAAVELAKRLIRERRAPLPADVEADDSTL